MVSLMRGGLAVLIACQIALAQFVKPREPVSPSGSLADGLIRAYCLTPADSLNGIGAGAIYDYAGIFNAQTIGTSGTRWTNCGTESPCYECGPTGTRWIAAGRGLDTLVTNQLSIVMRLKLTAAGTTNDAFSFIDFNPTQNVSSYFRDVDYDADATTFWIDGATSDPSINMGDLGNDGDIVTLIFIYNGSDSLYGYLNSNPTRIAAAVGGGNIQIVTNDLMAFGHSYNSGLVYWFGQFVMGCIWNRVLTLSERLQIQADPYVMFRAGSSDSDREIIARRGAARKKIYR